MSRFLIDSHTFLWFVGDDPRLPMSVKATLEDENASLFLSAASAFEIAIKHGLGKLPLDVPLRDLLGGALVENGIDLLPIEPRHLVVYSTLPFPASGHRDPFDTDPRRPGAGRRPAPRERRRGPRRLRHRPSLVLSLLP